VNGSFGKILNPIGELTGGKDPASQLNRKVFGADTPVEAALGKNTVASKKAKKDNDARSAEIAKRSGAQVGTKDENQLG